MASIETVIEHARAKDRRRFREALPSDPQEASRFVVSVLEAVRAIPRSSRVEEWIKKEFIKIRSKK